MIEQTVSMLIIHKTFVGTQKQSNQLNALHGIRRNPFKIMRKAAVRKCKIAHYAMVGKS